MRQDVVLVNENDEPSGIMEKLEAHQKGVLHRAFSVFIVNSKGEMLLHKRAEGKYHTPGLWTNACCSHPGPGEETLDAAKRRMKEEIGFTCPLNKLFDFIYYAKFDNGLMEYEFDHVFLGSYDGPVNFDPDEMSGCFFFSIKDIEIWTAEYPNEFTPWFLLAFPRVVSHLNQEK